MKKGCQPEGEAVIVNRQSNHVQESLAPWGNVPQNIVAEVDAQPLRVPTPTNKQTHFGGGSVFEAL